MAGMFSGATIFDQPLNSWTVSSVLSMATMFSSSPFNKPLNSWNVSSVTNMTSMFQQNTSFNQDISGWDVSSVTIMYGMFSTATSFDQNLGSWDMTGITTNPSAFSLYDMFGIAGTGQAITLSTSNYDAILIGWAAQTLASGVYFSGGDSQYSAGAAATARGTLTGAPNNWTIDDGGQV